MTKEEMIQTMMDLAWEHKCYLYTYDEDLEEFVREDPEAYADEIEDVMDRWNDLVPEAEKLGISHADMRKIWELNYDSEVE